MHIIILIIFLFHNWLIHSVNTVYCIVYLTSSRDWQNKSESRLNQITVNLTKGSKIELRFLLVCSTYLSPVAMLQCHEAHELHLHCGSHLGQRPQLRRKYWIWQGCVFNFFVFYKKKKKTTEVLCTARHAALPTLKTLGEALCLLMLLLLTLVPIFNESSMIFFLCLLAKGITRMSSTPTHKHRSMLAFNLQ